MLLQTPWIRMSLCCHFDLWAWRKLLRFSEQFGLRHKLINFSHNLLNVRNNSLFKKPHLYLNWIFLLFDFYRKILSWIFLLNSWYKFSLKFYGVFRLEPLLLCCKYYDWNNNNHNLSRLNSLRSPFLLLLALDFAVTFWFVASVQLCRRSTCGLGQSWSRCWPKVLLRCTFFSLLFLFARSLQAN